MALPARSRTIAIGLAALMLAGILALWHRDWTLPTSETHHIANASIAAEQGQAFTVPIGPIDFNTLRPVLQECHTEKVAPLGFLEGLLGGTRVHYYLNGVLSLRFPSLTRRTECREIGPGEQLHDDIRHLGHGRYSVWKGVLYFSSSDGTDPRTNARSYELQARPRLSQTARASLGFIGTLLTLGLALALAGRIPVIRDHRPGIVIAAGMLIILYAAAEAWLRYRIPFTETASSGRLHPVAGKQFKPGEEIHATNHAEYWVKERVNSLGFVDREPAIPKPAGTFRILVLGDSFVEAVQVPIADKLQVALERQLKVAFPGRALDVVAMGYSGIGQSGEISFYEAFGALLKPDLVIALVVGNDFANNSAVLEAIRYGWHPRHPPVMFYDADLAGAAVRRIDVDMEWAKHIVHRAGADPVVDFAVRTTVLRREPELARLLEGWQPPAGGETFLNVEALFCTASRLPVVRQADANTRYAFRQLADLGRRDGFKVIVVAAESVTTLCQEMSQPPDGLIRRLRAATDAVGLELFDLYPAFAATENIGAFRFRLDRHWNAAGHELAATAIARHLQKTPRLLAGSDDPRRPLPAN